MLRRIHIAAKGIAPRDNTAVLYCVVLYCIVLYCVMLYCVVLHFIILCCIVLYRIVLYCIVSYCIVLYCISNTDWHALFKKVLKAGVIGAQLQQDMEVTDDVFDEDLDADRTVEEIKAAVMPLKNGKAAGPDDIIREILNAAGEARVPFLVKC